jgi:hypothetical protein
MAHKKTYQKLEDECGPLGRVRSLSPFSRRPLHLRHSRSWAQPGRYLNRLSDIDYDDFDVVFKNDYGKEVPNSVDVVFGTGGRAIKVTDRLRDPQSGFDDFSKRRGHVKPSSQSGPLLLDITRDAQSGRTRSHGVSHSSVLHASQGSKDFGAGVTEQEMLDEILAKRKALNDPSGVAQTEAHLQLAKQLQEIAKTPPTVPTSMVEMIELMKAELKIAEAAGKTKKEAAKTQEEAAKTQEEALARFNTMQASMAASQQMAAAQNAANQVPPTSQGATHASVAQPPTNNGAGPSGSNASMPQANATGQAGGRVRYW